MRSFVHGSRRWLLAVVGVSLAFAVAACGSKNNSSSSGNSNVSKGSGIRASTGSRAEQATADGKKVGASMGAKVALPVKTIGIINFLNGIESSDRLAATAKLAASKLGWKTIQCDGKGTPTVFVACGNSLLDRGVDGIVEIAIDPSQIQSVLTKAKKAGVPVVQAGGGALPNGDLAGNYGPDEVKAGQVLTDGLIKKLGPGGGGVIIHDFPAAWAKDRTDQLRNRIKQGNTKLTILKNTITDAANIVPFTRKTTTDELTQYGSKVKAFWMAFDTTGQIAGQVISAKYAGKSFPDKPLVATFHADLGTLDLMRQGKIDMTSEANYDASDWIAVDQMAEYFARKTPPSQDNQPKYPVVGDVFSYEIIDSSNLPPKGQYVAPKLDVPSFFASKWQTEFTTG
ncbi:substrate-binding domain-containing protein [Baekduia soli]|uniref:Substrate-binding domain-containing protein n=1 Tax=Baekduia soli TaxID=496014 RepID=A0A5B8U4P1_9ACTN|nr:substrate-binding domain-containing protein [Baekduia soli]QEC48099.1 substrate-binding domain-containing protein [Baekduia soli]